MIQESLFKEASRTELTFDLDSVGAKNYLTHNFHPYPAKFIPQIPGAILDAYAKPGSTVLDPFAGSGTVAVEASLRGHHCVANDINPIATLITSAKVCVLAEHDRTQLNELLWNLRKGVRTDVPSCLIPNFKNRELWFNDQMIRELAFIRAQVQSTVTSPAAHTIARCAFSAIIVKCSNQESETHWRSIEKVLPVGFATRAYAIKLNDMIERSLCFNVLNTGCTKVVTGNALALDFLEDASVDVVLTSPPYANSHDYYLYNKLRMFWLGYDHYTVQRTEMGSRHRHSDLGEPISNYFDEMGSAFAEFVRVLKPAGTAAVVVGDSIYRSELIDMGVAFNRLAGAVGLKKIYHYDYDQRRYSSAFQRGFKKMPKRTHIMVFKK